MNDQCETTNVVLQENGIIRGQDGVILGRLNTKTCDEYRVWQCKIVVPNTNSFHGLDQLPRDAACEAVTNAGLDILTCFSGWGGTLDSSEHNDLMKQI